MLPRARTGTRRLPDHGPARRLLLRFLFSLVGLCSGSCSCLLFLVLFFMEGSLVPNLSDGCNDWSVASLFCGMRVKKIAWISDCYRFMNSLATDSCLFQLNNWNMKILFLFHWILLFLNKMCIHGFFNLS